MNYVASITALYAFFYSPKPPLSVNDGWTMYVPREEFGRMGVGTRTKAWRFTDINKDYSVHLSLSTVLHPWNVLALITHSDAAVLLTL